MMLIMLFNILKSVTACLRRSRMSHPRVAIKSVEIVWRLWSPLTHFTAQCCSFSRRLIWLLVYMDSILERHIQVLLELACYKQLLLHQVCMVRGFVLIIPKMMMI